mmetsp:Transcript_14051/g.17709  ORF Transcript_14051/g.17709 Transcript_14051/m.17709 type:complete len:267 (-) Transcript_14051:223-1023(-)|eukprot:CAMPEP_0172515888 /NCGR_PEP_ID=MMETSP1066-20121228/271707_1 /TAXON_ID=671091 /ORGANISM="Coscinodiscus wailesii, Strain CCMP2513" /LENGTH=266 /DNA_ID=CAMNT_0013297133 /DNA_START=162 /DNA_END=962 /DNA_ORIENTATION=-
MIHNLIGTRTLWKQVAIGMGAASFWRGGWYILDETLFPENSLYSAASSFGLGVISLSVFHNVVLSHNVPNSGGSSNATSDTTLTKLKAPKFPPPNIFYRARLLGGIYGLAWSCVLIWRGTWMAWDLCYEKYCLHLEEVSKNDRLIHWFSVKNHFSQLRRMDTAFDSHAVMDDHDAAAFTAATVRSDLEGEVKEEGQKRCKGEDYLDPVIHGKVSGLMSHVFASVVMASFGVLASVFAPPAAMSVVRDASLRVPKRSFSYSFLSRRK